MKHNPPDKYEKESEERIAEDDSKDYPKIKPLNSSLFVLLYFPCIATIAAIKGETGSWKWAGFAAGYTTLLAWVVSALVFQIGNLFI